MKVLIIGGTGLISTSITRYLLEHGDNVTHYNRGATQSRLELKVQTLTGDRKDFGQFEAQMTEAGSWDCVIDMICYSPEEAESDIRAFRGRTGQLIFCSTIDVYNKPATVYPYRENEARSKPLGDYAEKKVKCEDIFFAASERGDLPVTTIRPAHTYGDPGSIIHTFGWNTMHIDRLRKGKPIIVHGDGYSLWGSCHADDVGMAFANAAGNQASYGKSYHTTGDQCISWNQYHEIVAEAIGAPKPAITHIPTDVLVKLAPDRAGWLCALNFQFSNIFDNSAARRDLGFTQTVSLAEGASRTVAWQTERGKIENCDGDREYEAVLSAWERGCGLMEELVKAEQ